MTTEQAYSETGFQKIEVDIKSLSDFAHALRREFEENLLPAWERIGPTLDQGAQFGFSEELDLGEKRTVYDGYLRQAKLFLRDIIEGTDQLARAAEQIGANYSRADQFAKVQADDVHSVLPEVQQPSSGSNSRFL
jgi:hypothetical protein